MKAIFEQALSKEQPTSYSDATHFLCALFQALKEVQPSYSYSKFAEDLGFAPTGMMHQIIKKKRPLTKKTAERIAGALCLTGRQYVYFLQMVSYQRSKSDDERDAALQKMIKLKKATLQSIDEKDSLEYFREWHHAVVREILRISHSSDDPAWIASCITPKVRVEQVRKSLSLLQRLGMIKHCSEKGRLVVCEESVATPASIRSVALKNFHKQMIGLSKESLERFSAKERSVTSVTMSLSMQQYQRIQKELVAWQLRLLEEADRSDAGDSVYQFNIQMFPLAKLRRKA